MCVLMCINRYYMYTQADADEILLGHRRHVGSPELLVDCFNDYQVRSVPAKNLELSNLFFEIFLAIFGQL